LSITTAVSAPAERHDAARRYLLAVLLVALGSLIRFPFQSALGTSVPFIPFFPIVILSAWWGGLGPGLLSTGLSALAIFLFTGPAHNPAFQSTLLQLALFLGAGAFISFITHQFRNTRREAFEQARIARGSLELLQRERAERKRAEIAEERQRRLSTQTLECIEDAVIATDEQGRISFMNTVAEKLTGWRFTDVKDSPLQNVFRIFSEESGEAVESPLDRILRDGAVAGLANCTSLITRDGRQIPIDDSSAPICDDS
jgi:PAS domain S-box-containing protein